MKELRLANRIREKEKKVWKKIKLLEKENLEKRVLSVVYEVKVKKQTCSETNRNIISKDSVWHIIRIKLSLIHIIIDSNLKVQCY